MINLLEEKKEDIIHRDKFTEIMEIIFNGTLNERINFVFSM